MLSHVCHYWRALALSMVTMWSEFYFQCTWPIEAMKTLLGRSKQAPLTVGLDCYDVSSPGSGGTTLHTILQDFPRIQSLSLTVCEKDLAVLTSAELFEAPVLRQLSLCNADRDCPTGPWLQDFPQTLSVKYPALTHLYVENFRIVFTDWILPPTLTGLVLEGRGSFFQAPTSLNEVLLVLRYLPLLESLSLVNALPNHVLPTATQNSKSALLPSLKKLKLHSNFAVEQYRLFLESLTHPWSATIEFEFEMWQLDNIPAYFSLLEHSSADMRFRTIMFGIGVPDWDHENKPAFVFGAWRDEQPTTDFFPNMVQDAADFSLVLYYPHLEPFTVLSPGILTLINFPIRHAKTLSICYDLAVMPYPLEIYSVMREVETLHMFGSPPDEVDPVDDMIRILQDPDEFFPKLRFVILEWVDLEYRITEFKHALKARQKSSLPLEELVLRNADGLDDSDLGELKAMISVRWEEDGVETD